MLEIRHGEEGRLILAGRFDASQEATAITAFEAVSAPCIVDLKELDYISSLGLGVLLHTQKRLKASTGGGLTLVNANPHILDILRFAGFHLVFDIEGEARP